MLYENEYLLYTDRNDRYPWQTENSYYDGRNVGKSVDLLLDSITKKHSVTRFTELHRGLYKNFFTRHFQKFFSF